MSLIHSEPMDISRSQLVLAIRNKDPKLMASVYEACQKITYKLFSQEMETSEGWEDLFQDSMIIFYEKVSHPDFILTVKLTTYYAGICKYKIMEHIRSKTKRRKSKPIDEIDIPEDFEEKSKVDTFLDEFIDLSLHYCYERLVQKRKEILNRYYYHRQSMAEIASDLGLTGEAYAKVEKNRAINNLRECIEQ